MNDFLNKDVLQSADVMRSATNKAVSMLDVLRRASQRVAERFKGQPRTEASVRRQLGEIYLRMQYLTDAEAQFAKALALLEPLVSASDPELLSIRFGSVQTSVGIFRADEAVKKLAAAEGAAGPEILGGEGELALLATRARVEVMMDAQKNKEALPSALRLVELSDKLAATDIGVRFEARRLLSELYLRLDDKPRADALLAEIMAAPYSENSVGEVLFARAKLRLGRMRINEGRLAEAETLLVEVRDTMTRAFGPNQLHVGGANLELADLQEQRGEFGRASESVKAAITAFSASLGEQHSYVTIAKAAAAALEQELGRPASALRGLDEVRPRAVENKQAAPLVAGIDFARAKALTDLGRAAEAMAILDTMDVEQLAQSSWGPRDFQWQLEAEKGRARMGLGQRSEGVELVRHAVGEMEHAGSHAWMLARYRQLLHEPVHVARR